MTEQPLESEFSSETSEDSGLPLDLNSHFEILQRYCAARSEIDREEVVAHATLSALVHHWPSHADETVRLLLEETWEIRSAEKSRWITQRRIAIARLAKALVV